MTIKVKKFTTHHTRLFSRRHIAWATVTSLVKGRSMAERNYYQDARERLTALEERDKLSRIKRRINEEIGLPELTPRTPGYGYSRGAWTREDAEEAEVAVRGAHFVTGEKAKSRRIKA
jgi:hypothetical protein